MSKETLTCRACGKTKPLGEFAKRFSIDKKHNYAIKCSLCSAQEQISMIYKDYRSFLRRAYTNAQTRARRKNNEIEFNFPELLDIFEQQKGLCAITGLPMTWGHENQSSNSGTRRGTNISIDRMDSDKGYTLDNIRLVCDRVNKIRSNMNDHDLYFWCAQIAKNFRDPS